MLLVRRPALPGTSAGGLEWFQDSFYAAKLRLHSRVASERLSLHGERSGGPSASARGYRILCIQTTSIARFRFHKHRRLRKKGRYVSLGSGLKVLGLKTQQLLKCVG